MTDISVFKLYIMSSLLYPVNWVGATIRSLTAYTRFKYTNETYFDFIYGN